MKIEKKTLVARHSLVAGIDEERGGGVGQSPIVATEEVSAEGGEGEREGG